MLYYIILVSGSTIEYEGFVRWNLGKRPSLVEGDVFTYPGLWRLGLRWVVTLAIDAYHTIQGVPVLLVGFETEYRKKT